MAESMQAKAEFAKREAEQERQAYLSEMRQEMTRLGTWTPEAIRELLLESDSAVYRALLALHARQTPQERSARETREDNARGFNACDARRLSMYAEWVADHYRQPEPRRYPQAMNRYHTGIARQRLLKYAHQLADIANRE